jgi:hypothetical protein
VLLIGIENVFSASLQDIGKAGKMNERKLFRYGFAVHLSTPREVIETNFAASHVQ